MSDYALVGEDPADGQPKKAFLLDLSDLKSIIPKDYFVTTGEAIVKLDYMINDIQTLLKESRKLKKKLERSKGDSKWLETTWEDNQLIVKKKDARIKKS